VETITDEHLVQEYKLHNALTITEAQVAHEEKSLSKPLQGIYARASRASEFAA
jgi:hypothetical protein